MTLIKSYDYLSFKTAERNIKKIRPLLIRREGITLSTNPKGVDLISDNISITKNIGFHGAIKNLEKWHDSTQADFNFLKKEDSLIVESWWWNVPIKCKWVITAKSRSIMWSTILMVENCITIEEIKVGLIIDESYNDFFLNENNLAVSANSILPNIPSLKFKVIESLYPCKTIAGNLNTHNNSGLLQVVIEDELEFESGEYKLFKLEIIVT